MGSQQPIEPLGSVLVVGGCGFLGHHIVQQLLESGLAQVSVLDLRTERNRFPSASYYDGDISSVTDVQKVLQTVKPEVIIHTASPTIVAGAKADLFRKVNIDGTRNLVECAGQLGCVKAFVYTSSASVVHDGVGNLVNADERLPVLRQPVQTEVYSETKGIAEELVLAANRKYGDMLTIAIRPAAIFGEGDAQMLPGMLDAYDRGMWKVQLGKNENLFDFTYVGNLAHAHILAARALLDARASSVPPPADKRVEGEAFFITNDDPMKFWDFARAVWAAAGHQVDPKEIWVLPAGLMLAVATMVEWIFWLIFQGRKQPKFTRRTIKYSTLTRTYRIDKAKNRLGYKPLVGVREGIQRGVEWFTKHKQGVEKKSQ